MTDAQLLKFISCYRFELPRVIAKRAGKKSVNSQLGRLHRSGVLERVHGSTCFMYRSRQAEIV